MTSTFVYCRAMVAVVSAAGKDSLDDGFAVMLQDLMFSEYMRAEDASLVPSPNQRAVAELFASVLGHLAKWRFLSVTDHFIDELIPVANGQVTREGDPRFEHLVNGLRAIEINVWPHERFEEASEFIESLAKAFQNAHGHKLKIAFAETLTLLLHPVNKDAQEELDEPQWAQAIEIIHAKAVGMLSKPRYAMVAYQLAVTSLCVSSQDYFAKHWMALCDLSLIKLKDRNSRTVAYGAITRLVWTYIFRGRESNSMKSTKLENFVRQIILQGRRFDESLEPLVYMCHFIISRTNLQYGSDLALELLQQSNLAGISNLNELSTPDKVAVGVRAIMLSIPCMLDGSRPAWPSSSDFSIGLSAIDYPLEAVTLSPETLAASEDAQILIDQFSAAVAKLGRLAMRAVGSMSVLDPRFRFDHTLTAEDREQIVVRHHPDGTVCSYPKPLVPQLELLQACFEAWPRCLHHSLSELDAIDGAIRAVAHAEPAVASAATECLLRFSAEERYVLLVLRLYNRSLFAPASLSADPNWRIVTEHTQRVSLWLRLVQNWADMKVDEEAAAQGAPSESSLPTITPQDVIDQIEGGGLFLLSSTDVSVRPFGLRVLRLLPKLKERYLPDSASNSSIIDILTGTSLVLPMPIEGSLALSDQESIRMNKWRESDKFPDYLIRLLEGDNHLDHLLWSNMLPSLVRECVVSFSTAMDLCRESLNAAVMRYHPMITALAGMSSSRVAVPTARGAMTPSRAGSFPVSHEFTNEQRNDVGQWRVWIMALCACAVAADEKPPAAAGRHNRIPSDASNSREKLSTARGLFRHLIPFLASEYSLFRDAVVSALGCTHAATFGILLEDLRSITSHLYDDGRAVGLSKMGFRRTREQDRVHLAVVRVYALTAEFINNSAVFHNTAAVTLLWNFVQRTQNFLTRQDVRLDWELTRLRQYFCHIVEQLFSVPVLQLQAVVPESAYLGLYRLCEEWCPYGPSAAHQEHEAAIANSIGSTIRNQAEKKQTIDRLRSETASLGPAAAAAMACLSSGAFFSSADQMNRSGSGGPKPLKVAELMDWITALLAAESKTPKNVTVSGRKALDAVLLNQRHDLNLLNAIIRRSFYTTTSPTSRLYYEELTNILTTSTTHHFTPHQSFWFGLVHLTSKHLDIRIPALKVLKTCHLTMCSPATLAQLDTMIHCLATHEHCQAMQQVSAMVAETNPGAALGVLAEATHRLPQYSQGFVRDSLMCLVPWIPHLQLLSSDGSLSLDGYGALTNIFSLTVRYEEMHPEAIRSLWATLVADVRLNHCETVLDFLVNEAVTRATGAFVFVGRKIVAYLARIVGPAVFGHFISILKPEAMLVPSHPKSHAPPGEDPYFVEDLAVLLPNAKSRPHYSPAELAVAYISDAVPYPPWQYSEHLATMLHVIVTMVDHRNLLLRTHMRQYLFQLLRSWCIHYFHRPEIAESVVGVFKMIDAMEEDSELFWSNSNTLPANIEPKLGRLCNTIVEVFQPIEPGLRQSWAEVAVVWGNRCPVRDSACRALEVFRVLSIHPQSHMAHDMIERLSNTVSDTSNSDTRFAKELMRCLVVYSKTPSLSNMAKAVLFWSATACLLTAVEAEFLSAMEFMDEVLNYVDLNDESTVEHLRAHKPHDWEGVELAVERLAFCGLRSSETFMPAFALLARIAQTAGGDIVAVNDGLLRHLYTASLPFALRSIEDGIADEKLTVLSSSIATLAQSKGRNDIAHIMTSVARARFKRKEDFLRQAATALRDNFWNSHANDLMTILLGCVLNSETWMRTKTLQMMKALLQNANSKNPIQLNGSELLLPLLRLLSTDLASDAMEVLDTPMIIAGGPSASHVVRMSIHNLLSAEAASEVVVFGSPSPSGWSIASPDEQSRICRTNVSAVVASSASLVKHPSGTMSTVLFVHEEEHHNPSNSEPSILVHRSQPSADAISLGELVNTLHDLNNFFQSDVAVQPSSRTLPGDDQDDAARRVAAILSRSLARTNQRDAFDSGEENMNGLGYSNGWEIPPTPFVDLFENPAANPMSSSDALQRNFMRTAEESDGEDDDDVRSDIAHHHGGHAFYASRAHNGGGSEGHGGSQGGWESEDPSMYNSPEEYRRHMVDRSRSDSEWAPNTPVPQRRGSIRKVKEMLSPKRGQNRGGDR
ncbi:hypothetical protein DL93DRAFT_2083290 [Clavulina sp. PMI_390]|nr:hypothetical protein DL93DRAFT_2087184 [Clavulina sp. PMI_390]KAF8311335.1 hypothetical protein DL93DRAFT_2083290 [Clavulina sp. PMI_390]